MPTIQVSDQTFDRLRVIAIPFVDKTPEDVVIRLLNELVSVEAPKTGTNTKEYNPVSPPPLTFTKLLRASVNNEPILPARWNNLLDQTLRHSILLAKDVHRVVSACPTNVATGRRTDSGYRYLSDLGISVQGQDAEDAWRAVVALASAFGLSVAAEFIWRPNEKAAHPGAGGTLRLNM